MKVNSWIPSALADREMSDYHDITIRVRIPAECEFLPHPDSIGDYESAEGYPARCVADLLIDGFEAMDWGIVPVSYRAFGSSADLLFEMRPHPETQEFPYC